MRDLRVGDRVLAVGSDDVLAFSDIYFFGHADPDTEALYVKLWVATEVLHLSSEHFVPICRSPIHSCEWQTRVEVYAKDVQVGDAMWVAGSALAKPSKVIAIDSSFELGLFNPYTMQGNIVVDGIIASCHSSWIIDEHFPTALRSWLPAVYQAMFLPGRWIYWLFGPEAANVLDMNSPQVSPETFGYGPVLMQFLYGFIPMLVTMLCFFKRVHGKAAFSCLAEMK